MQIVLPAEPDWSDFFQERYSCSIDQSERKPQETKMPRRGYSFINQRKRKK